jgi:hypothetical protein
VCHSTEMLKFVLGTHFHSGSQNVDSQFPRSSYRRRLGESIAHVTSSFTSDPGFHEDHLTGYDEASILCGLILAAYASSGSTNDSIAVQIQMCRVRQELPRRYPASRLGKHRADLSASDLESPSHTNE